MSASYDYSARIWNTATGDCQAELKGHSGSVNSAIFSSDGKHIVSASSDAVRIWNIPTGDYQAEPNNCSDLINSAIFSLHNVFISHDFNNQIYLSLQSSSLDIYKDIIIHTKNLQQIWIPPVFQNAQWIGHHLSKICLAYGSGDILILEVCIHDL